MAELPKQTQVFEKASSLPGAFEMITDTQDIIEALQWGDRFGNGELRFSEAGGWTQAVWDKNWSVEQASLYLDHTELEETHDLRFAINVSTRGLVMAYHHRVALPNSRKPGAERKTTLTVSVNDVNPALPPVFASLYGTNATGRTLEEHAYPGAVPHFLPLFDDALATLGIRQHILRLRQEAQIESFEASWAKAA